MITYRGSGLLNKTINSLPIELHIPGYQFCGPGTKLNKRLERGDQGINLLDTYCREHDISYSQSNSLKNRHEADKILQEKAWRRVKAKDSTFGEKVAAWTVTNAMKAKRKFGMGLKSKQMKKTKKRVIPAPRKQGGFLPALIPLLPLIGKALLAGAASGAASYGAQKILKGKGLYLKPYKRGSGIKQKKKKKPTKKHINLKNYQKGR